MTNLWRWAENNNLARIGNNKNGLLVQPDQNGELWIYSQSSVQGYNIGKMPDWMYCGIMEEYIRGQKVWEVLEEDLHQAYIDSLSLPTSERINLLKSIIYEYEANEKTE